MRIEPATSFRGCFRLPGDKSISHRAAILGAMAEGRTRIRHYSTAADCGATLACLSALGVGIRREADDVSVESDGVDSWRTPATTLDAGNSGSTLRMLTGALAGRPFRSVLSGDASLRRRPVERVAVALRRMGASVETTAGRPPLAVAGGRLRAITYDLPVASAQVKTAILLAGLQADGETTVKEPGPSRDHTERMLPAFGAEVSSAALATTVKGGQRLRAAEVLVPGDASSAAFLIVAALVLPGSELRLDGVLLSPTRAAFLDVLRAMGADVEVLVEQTEPEPTGSILARCSSLRGTSVGAALVPSLIDELPALAVAAAFAEGTFSVTGAAELRLKESDRITAMAEGLHALGARVSERPDGLVVEGGRPLHGGVVRSHGDHRVAMALSVAALGASSATEVDDAECVSVSFPEFYSLLAEASGRA